MPTCLPVLPWYVVHVEDAKDFCVAFSGANLLSNKQLTGVACLQGRIKWYKMLLHWFICFWGNLAGCLFVMAIIFGCKLPCLCFVPRDSIALEQR